MYIEFSYIIGCMYKEIPEYIFIFGNRSDKNMYLLFYTQK